MKIKPLFDKKHIVTTISLIVILLGLSISGVQAVVSGVAVGTGNTVLEDSPIVVHDIIESKPAPVDAVVPAVEASSGGGGGGGSSPAPVENEEVEEDIEEVEEAYSKIGIVSISSGAIIAVGNMSV